jgi:hypothetical protein
VVSKLCTYEVSNRRIENGELSRVIGSWRMCICFVEVAVGDWIGCLDQHRPGTQGSGQLLVSEHYGERCWLGTPEGPKTMTG